MAHTARGLVNQDGACTYTNVEYYRDCYGLVLSPICISKKGSKDRCKKRGTVPRIDICCTGGSGSMEDGPKIDDQVERYTRVSNALQEFEGCGCKEAPVVRQELWQQTR